MPTALKRPLSSSQFLMTIQGIPLKFAKCSGGEEKYDVGTYIDPDDRRKKSTRGVGEITNVTLGIPYHPDNVAPLYDLKARHDRGELEDFTITKQAVVNNADSTPVGAPTTYYGCQIVNWKPPEGDISKSETAMLEFECTVDRITNT